MESAVRALTCQTEVASALWSQVRYAYRTFLCDLDLILISYALVGLGLQL